MSLLIRGVAVMIVCLSISCQAPILDHPVPLPSTSAPGEQDYAPVFSVNAEQACVGNEVLISLTSSNLNRGSIPIFLQKTSGPLVNEHLQPGGNKLPPIPLEDTVALGSMPVSPLGIGSFAFTLKAEYTTRKGDPFVIHSNQSYILYWEPREGAVAFIHQLTPCSF